MNRQNKSVSLGDLADKVGIFKRPVSMSDVADKVGFKKQPIVLGELAEAVERYVSHQGKE